MGYIICLLAGVIIGVVVISLCRAADFDDHPMISFDDYLDCNERLCEMCKLASYGMKRPDCEQCQWNMEDLLNDNR